MNGYKVSGYLLNDFLNARKYHDVLIPLLSFFIFVTISSSEHNKTSFLVTWSYRHHERLLYPSFYSLDFYNLARVILPPSPVRNDVTMMFIILWRHSIIPLIKQILGAKISICLLNRTNGSNVIFLGLWLWPFRILARFLLKNVASKRSSERGKGEDRKNSRLFSLEVHMFKIYRKNRKNLYRNL